MSSGALESRAVEPVFVCSLLLGVPGDDWQLAASSPQERLFFLIPAPTWPCWVAINAPFVSGAELILHVVKY